jgi:phosphoribosylformylglycinamidine synthase
MGSSGAQVRERVVPRNGAEEVGSGARVCDDGRMIFEVHVDVQLRSGIADPQGSTIERSLPTLGFEGIDGVRVGKSIRFRIDAPDEAAARSRVDDLCARFLTNPVIEDASVELREQVGSPA